MSSMSSCPAPSPMTLVGVGEGHSFACLGKAMTSEPSGAGYIVGLGQPLPREAGVALSAFASRLQRRGRCRHGQSDDRHDACGSQSSAEPTPGLPAVFCRAALHVLALRVPVARLASVTDRIPTDGFSYVVKRFRSLIHLAQIGVPAATGTHVIGRQTPSEAHLASYTTPARTFPCGTAPFARHSVHDGQSVMFERALAIR